MKSYNTNAIIPGNIVGESLVTTQAINFTAAFTKLSNMIPSKRAEMLDRHHDLFKINIQNKILFFPTCIGSTHTGLVLLDLVRMKRGPAAIIVQQADPLLVSGVILSDVWYGPKIPILEYSEPDLYSEITNGKEVHIKENIISFS